MRAYIEEDVRRACLWRVLAAQDGDRTGQDWWAYYEAFAAACSTEKGTFTAKCSRQVRRRPTHSCFLTRAQQQGRRAVR